MNEIERKVDLLVSGIVLPQKRTRRRVATIATTLLIASALIVGASLIGFYVQIGGDIEVENLLWLDEAPALETPIIENPINDLVPGCTVFDGSHTLWLNPDYDANPQFTVYFHIDVTETLSDTTPGDGLGLEIEIWDATDPTPENHYKITSEPPQMELSPGTGTPENPLNAKIFQIRVKADPDIDSTSTYGYTVTLDWENSI